MSHQNINCIFILDTTWRFQSHLYLVCHMEKPVVFLWRYPRYYDYLECLMKMSVFIWNTAWRFQPHFCLACHMEEPEVSSWRYSRYLNHLEHRLGSSILFSLEPLHEDTRHIFVWHTTLRKQRFLQIEQPYEPISSTPICFTTQVYQRDQILKGSPLFGTPHENISRILIWATASRFELHLCLVCHNFWFLHEDLPGFLTYLECHMETSVVFSSEILHEDTSHIFVWYAALRNQRFLYIQELMN